MLFFFVSWTVCQPPYLLENGGFTCHPSPCRRLSHSTVIEYFCDEGYILKGDYKYLTCQYGEWDSQVKLSCVMEQGRSDDIFDAFDKRLRGDNLSFLCLKDHNPALPLGMPALSIVASTASSVALILLLVVLFVLLQPKLKSFHRWVFWGNFSFGAAVYGRGVKLIFAKSHITIMVTLKGPIVVNYYVSCLTWTKHKASCSTSRWYGWAPLTNNKLYLVFPA